MALIASITSKISATQTTSVDFGVATLPIQRANTVSYTSGTGNGQADVIFTDQRTLTASANEDLDLVGVLTNPLVSGTLTFVKLKAIKVSAAAANTNNVVVTRPAANGVPIFAAASDALSVPPGGEFTLACSGTAGLATVTTGTGDLINIANSAGGTSVTYDITLIGTSA